MTADNYIEEMMQTDILEQWELHQGVLFDGNGKGDNSPWAAHFVRSWLDSWLTIHGRPNPADRIPERLLNKWKEMADEKDKRMSLLAKLFPEDRTYQRSEAN